VALLEVRSIVFPRERFLAPALARDQRRDLEAHHDGDDALLAEIELVVLHVEERRRLVAAARMHVGRV